MRYLALLTAFCVCVGVFGCAEEQDAWYFSNDILAENIVTPSVPSSIPETPVAPSNPIKQVSTPIVRYRYQYQCSNGVCNFVPVPDSISAPVAGRSTSRFQGFFTRLRTRLGR